jgi:hypothetical protein
MKLIQSISALDRGTAHPVSIMCDWTTGVHRFREPVKPLEAGRIMKVDRDGCIEWEKNDWETIRCPSSDTSIRISCDGNRLRFMGNIGRFKESDNLQGLSVVDAVGKWTEILDPFGLDLRFFGTVQAKGTVSEYGTTLSRVDLAGNYAVDDFKSWCIVTMQKRLGRKLPLMGKYGPSWGYEARRSNWWKAKIYDKDAELAGERGPRSGATTARFEIQLGSEYLKREGLNYVAAWKPQEGRPDMGQIIYGRFSTELFKEMTTVETWEDIPPRLRQYAILWRDGVDPRTLLKRSGYYSVASKLREYGIDIAQPCNVVALSRRVREVSVQPLPALRVA